MGIATAQEGDADRAAALLHDALQRLRALDHQLAVATALYNLGSLALRRGEIERGESHLVESIGIFQQFGNRWAVVASLAGLAEAAAKRGHLRRAAALIGAVDAQLASLGTHLDTPAQEPYRRTAEAARTRLGDEEWAAARAWGAAMRFDEAVAYGLDLTSGAGVRGGWRHRHLGRTKPQNARRRS